MSGYHPALDAYHSAFRMLRLLSHDPSQSYEVDRLRILDFYLAFPQLIGQIKLPKESLWARKEFRTFENPYTFSGSPRMVFMRMAPLQNAAIRLLLSAGVLDPDGYRDGVLRVTEIDLPGELTSRILELDAEQEQLLSFLTDDLAGISLLGPKGLKDRTGLLEWRYDSV